MNPSNDPNPPAGPSPSKTIVLTLTPEEKPGDKIGHYKLLQILGEGGCGIVYMAEQEEPVRRRVALKVIKLGMDTKQVIARFEAERQALAMMDHPNIAKVLDAGATEKGRSFFVMELVRGIKITDYCDQNKLSTRERLNLFTQVCNAIQHAHQKGIIHRDIKPSNILVTLHDGVPVPKVIDFGIAKATQGRLTDQTLFTAFEQFIGTPAYMSPEQAEMSGLDIDTRSDIYALGVLLYELLTGRTPFDAKELVESGLDALRRTIREKEPARPSTRLSTMIGADLSAVAQRRQSEPPKLIHLLRGDLDWIVMKALEKDRTRRFETANALAMDVQRHLSNEPVLARPPSNVYRFQKLVRRNKTAFAAIGTGIGALVIGLALSVFLFIREREAHRRAVAAEKEQASLREQAEAGRALEATMRQRAELREKMGRKISMAGLLLSQGQPEKAEPLIREVPPEASLGAFYNIFGSFHGKRGEWREAITNYSRVVEFFPNDYSAYHYLAPLLLQVGDVESYTQHREKILSRFAGTSDPVAAERLAKDCLILAPGTNLAVIGKMANAALAAGPTHKSWGYFEFVEGLAEYRRGNFASAADWLQKVLLEGHWTRKVSAFMVLAMAQCQLKQDDQARATLDEGLKTAERNLNKLGEGLGEDWNDWIIAHLLMREAQELIESAKK